MNKVFLLTYTIEGEAEGGHHKLPLEAPDNYEALKKAEAWLKLRPRCTYVSLDEEKEESSTEDPLLLDTQRALDWLAVKEAAEPKITVSLFIMTIEDPLGNHTRHPVYAPDLQTAWTRANIFYNKAKAINQEYRRVEQAEAALVIEAPGYPPEIYQTEMEMSLEKWESITRSEAHG